MAEPIETRSAWPEAMATVTACKYEFGAGRALAFGLPVSRHFVISFNYFVDGALHTGQFSATKAIPQNTLFPIRYNPERPAENERSGREPVGRAAILAVGVVGSVVLSLAWLLILRGCQ